MTDCASSPPQRVTEDRQEYNRRNDTLEGKEVLDLMMSVKAGSLRTMLADRLYLSVRNAQEGNL